MPHLITYATPYASNQINPPHHRPLFARRGRTSSLTVLTSNWLIHAHEAPSAAAVLAPAMVTLTWGRGAGSDGRGRTPRRATHQIRHRAGRPRNAAPTRHRSTCNRPVRCMSRPHELQIWCSVHTAKDTCTGKTSAIGPCE